jgi:hypothetical protein
VEWKDRLWDKQLSAGSNGRLAARYSAAFGDSKRMRALVDEPKTHFGIRVRVPEPVSTDVVAEERAMQMIEDQIPEKKIMEDLEDWDKL